MSRLTSFNSPYLLGFDQLEQVLDRLAKNAADGYPPYNIEYTGADSLRITLAVAGFGRDDLAVTVEENQLVIRGKQADDANKTFLHRGIAARQFQRAFVLADGIETTGADLTNGLLHIELERKRPTPVVKRIEISAGQTAQTARSHTQKPAAQRSVEPNGTLRVNNES